MGANSSAGATGNIATDVATDGIATDGIAADATISADAEATAGSSIDAGVSGLLDDVLSVVDLGDLGSILGG